MQLAATVLDSFAWAADNSGAAFAATLASLEANEAFNQ